MFGLTADTYKTFLRIITQQIDRDCVHFLWTSEKDNPFAPPQTYRFKSVLYDSMSTSLLFEAALHKQFGHM